jgi:asparagine synthase (glutamine-hydrolysing)
MGPRFPEEQMSLIRRIGRKLRSVLKPRSTRVPQDIPDAVARVWRRVKREGLTYLSDQKLASLVRLCADIEQRSSDGILIETGCALGGSAIVMCAAKSPDRPLLVYDVFGLIPPPGPQDGQDVHERYEIIKSGKSAGIGGNRYYGYENGLYDKVLAAFETHGFPPEQHHVSLIKGLIQDTLVGTEPVCLAHIDVDWYEPVLTCLQRIVPRLTPHGVLVLDDYHDWSGCRKAVDEFFDDQLRKEFEFDSSAGHLVVRRRT